MKQHDPDQGSPPEAWLALDEQKRIHLCEEYHGRRGIPSALRHAVARAMVENRFALGVESVVTVTLARLSGEGLDRHDAMHAIGSVLSAHLDSLFAGSGQGRRAGRKIP